MIYSELIRLMTTKRNNTESFRDFESRLSAQILQFNELAFNIAISGSMYALMLLANANAHSSQRASILVAASPSSDDDKFFENTDILLQLIHYDDVGTIM